MPRVLTPQIHGAAGISVPPRCSGPALTPRRSTYSAPLSPQGPCTPSVPRQVLALPAAGCPLWLLCVALRRRTRPAHRGLERSLGGKKACEKYQLCFRGAPILWKALRGPPGCGRVHHSANALSLPGAGRGRLVRLVDIDAFVEKYGRCSRIPWRPAHLFLRLAQKVRITRNPPRAAR